MSKNVGGFLKQAQQMQSKLASIQDEIANQQFEVISNGGAVKVKVNGKQVITQLELSNELIESSDKELIEESIKVAVNQAMKESTDAVSNAMGKLTGGLSIPGLF